MYQQLAYEAGYYRPKGYTRERAKEKFISHLRSRGHTLDEAERMWNYEENYRKRVDLRKISRIERYRGLEKMPRTVYAYTTYLPEKQILEERMPKKYRITNYDDFYDYYRERHPTMSRVTILTKWNKYRKGLLNLGEGYDEY